MECFKFSVLMPEDKNYFCNAIPLALLCSRSGNVCSNTNLKSAVSNTPKPTEIEIQRTELLK